LLPVVVPFNGGTEYTFGTIKDDSHELAESELANGADLDHRPDLRW
jgi:hypothetical protein